MKIVLTGDWHLDARTGGVERRDEIERVVLDGPVAAAIAERADLFAFLGDLADPGGRTSVHDAAFPIVVAHRLREAGVSSVWIPGNHDVVLRGEPYTILDALAQAFGVVEGGTFEVGRGSRCGRDEGRGHVLVSRVASYHHVVDARTAGRRVLRLLLLPYRPANSARDEEDRVAVEAARADVDALDGLPLVALGHRTSFPSRAPAAPASEEVEYARGGGHAWPAELPRVALAANGHFHDAQDVELDGGYVVHVPGSIVPLTFGDANRVRGYLVAEVPG